MERQPRDRGLRRHVVRGRRQGHGRGKGPRLLREAGGDEAADPQRPYAHDRARGRGRDPDRTDALQSGGGQVEGAGRADRLEALAAGVRPRRRHRPGETGAASARGAALRGFRAVPGRPAHHQGGEPGAGQSHGRQLVPEIQFPHHRCEHAGGRVGHLGKALADPVSERNEVGTWLAARKSCASAGTARAFCICPAARRPPARWSSCTSATAWCSTPATSRIALMGVCQSGRYPIVVGSRRRDLAACAVFYGASQTRDWNVSELQPQPMQEMMRRLAAPALFVFGERDHTISLADVRRTRDALEEGRCSYRMKVFRDMPHGWLNDTMPGRYRAKEAGEAWGVLLEFLAEVFSGTWPGAGQVRWEFEGASSADYDFSKNARLQ